MTEEQMIKKMLSGFGKKSAEARKAKMGEEGYAAYIKSMSLKGLEARYGKK